MYTTACNHSPAKNESHNYIAHVLLIDFFVDFIFQTIFNLVGQYLLQNIILHSDKNKMHIYLRCICYKLFWNPKIYCLFLLDYQRRPRAFSRFGFAYRRRKTLYTCHGRCEESESGSKLLIQSIRSTNTGQDR